MRSKPSTRPPREFDVSSSNHQQFSVFAVRAGIDPPEVNATGRMAPAGVIAVPFFLAGHGTRQIGMAQVAHQVRTDRVDADRAFRGKIVEGNAPNIGAGLT